MLHTTEALEKYYCNQCSHFVNGRCDEAADDEDYNIDCECYQEIFPYGEETTICGEDGCDGCVLKYTGIATCREYAKSKGGVPQTNIAYGTTPKVEVVNNDKKPLIVNLFGAPGTGKSTGAAYIFSKFKMAGINAELVTEFAKDKVWEEAHAPFENQLYMLAKQYFRITRCENKVDVIVTDSPILLSLIYNNDKERLGAEFDSLVKHLFKHYNNYNVLLKRVKPYNPIGRFQTENESDKLGGKIENMLLNLNIPYFSFNGDIEGYEEIVDRIISKIQQNGENYE